MIEPGVNYADLFAKEVRKHPKKYPKTVRLAIDRWYRWKKRKDIWFDVDRANEMMDWVESFIVHTKGDMVGKPFLLEPWEKFIYSWIYGWVKENEKGQVVRVTREAYVQIPKKNGKTLIAVGALGYAMYGEGALSVDCYACASDFAQAQYAAKPFAATILNNPVLLDGTKIFKGPKGTVSSITYDYLHGDMAYTNKFIVQTKNIDNIEGSNPYFVLNDELHKQEKMEQYDNFKSAQISLPQPLMFNISTAGKGSSSVGIRVYKEAKEVLKRDDNDSNFVLIYEPNKGYDWTDRKVWEMCNPNWGISVDLSALESAFKTAQRSAHSKAEFLTKHLDVFVNGADNFFEQDQVETVALLSKLDVDKHINIEIELDELDLTSAESKATYAQIKEYVWNKFELKVPTLYIAQIKRKCGIELREHYNKSKKEKQIIPQCTPEKEEAIMDALRHFKMI